MDKYAQLASLFTPAASTGRSDLDQLFGLRPISDEELAARKAERQARIDELLSEEQGVEPSQGGYLPTKIPTLSGSAKERAAQIAPAIKAASEKHGVPFDLLMGMTQVESGFNPAATSRVGAMGTAQFMPATAKQYGLSNPRDPVASADAQARYMRDLLDMFGGDETKAIAAYNAGQGTIQRAKSIPNMGYVNSVRAARTLYGGQPSVQAPAGSPADQMLPAQPEVDMSQFDLVTLTNGTEAYIKKGLSPEETIAKLQAQGIDALPTRPMKTPSGENVLVRFNMSDAEALAKLKESHPEYLQRPSGAPAEEDKSGALAAFKKGVYGGVAPIATGLGGEAQRLGEYLGPESTIGQYATEAGTAMREYGAETAKKAEEAFKMPENAGFLAKNIGYPLAEGAGQLIPYGAAFAVPGAGLGTATGLTALYGGAMGEAEQKAKEVGKPFVPEEARPWAGADVALNMVGLRMLGPLKKVFGPEAVEAPQAFVRGLIEKEGIEGAKAKMGTMVTDVLKGMGVTGGANIANEVAEDMLYRGYAGQDLFNEDALQSYLSTAKQVAPIGIGMGGVHGVAQRSAKVEALTREQEQREAAQAEAAQIEREREAVLAEDLKSARVGYEKLGIESPAEAPFEQRRQALDDYLASREAEKEAARTELPEDLQQLPMGEAQLLQRARAEGEKYYAPLGLPERGRNVAVKRSALDQLDISNPEHATAIGQVLDEIERQDVPFNPAGMKALRQQLGEVRYGTSGEQITVPSDGGGIEGQEGIKEAGYPPVSGEGVRSSDQEGQGIAGEGEVQKEVKEPVTDINHAAYQITGQPAYETHAPLSHDDALFELEVLQDAAKAGKLTPERFANSEIGQRLDTGHASAISSSIRQGDYSALDQLAARINETAKTQEEPSIRAVTESPDLGRLPLDVNKFTHAKNGRDVINSFLEYGTDENLIRKANLFKASPRLGNVEVNFVSLKDKLPNNIREAFESRSAGAVTSFGDDKVQVYFRTDDPESFSEDNVIHEITHAMTEGGLSRNPELTKELEGLAGTIHTALAQDHPEAAEFWQGVVKGDSSEALAYGTTSPTFRDILSQYDENGVRIPEKVPEAAKPRTLWDKFKDFMSRVFGIPTGRRAEFSKNVDESLAANKAPVVKAMTTRLDQALMQAYRETAEKGIIRGEPRKLKAVQRETVEEEITPPTPEEQARLVEKAKKSGLTAVAQKGGLGSTVGSMMTSMVDKGILLPFQTAVFDERAPLGNALNKMGANVGTKLRGDLVYGAYSQRFNTIEQGINNGYTVMGRDGTLEAVNDSQLAPQKILERIRDYGKQLGMSNGEAWKVVSEMLVRLRAGTIREQDAKTRQEAQNYLSAADELSSYAATKATAEEKRKFREAAAKLRNQAQKKLDSIGDDGRTYVTQEEVEAGRKLYMAYKDTLSREVDNIHNLLKTIPDKLQAAGMIDAKTAKQYRDYPFYFPFYDKAQFDEAVIDPLKEETLNTFLSGMGRGLKSVAEVKRQERHGHTIYTADNLLRHIMYWDSAVAEHTARTITCEQLEMTGGATRLTGEPTDKNFVIKVKRDGKDTFYKIHDPTVYYAFQASAPVTGPIINVLRKMARFQRGVAVFNPLFWYKQVIRDPKQVSRIAKVGAITPIDALGELAKITTGKSEGYKRLVAKGVVGPVDVGSNPQERIQSLVQGKGVSEKVYNKLNEIHEAVDAATRAIVYNRAIAKYKKWGLGEDVADALAIKDAREVMNFSRRGKSQMLNTLRSVTPFLGSYINSIDVLLKAFSPEKYGRMSKADAMEMRRNFIGISSSMAIMSLGYSLAMSDDEEWVNNADRNGNILVRNPFSNRKEKPFIALPLEFEIGWLQHTLPENLILAQLGAIAPTTEKANLKESASKALMPPTDFFSYARPLINYVMTLEERNAPGGAPKGYEGLKEFQDEKATEISKMLAEELKSAGIQMFSPNDIESSMNSLFGGYWAVAQSVSAYMLANQEGKAVAPAKTLTESLPWFGKMFSGEYRDVAVRDAFKVLEEVQQVQNTFSKIKTTKDISKYNAFVASPEYVKAAQADKALNGLSEQITGISSKIATVTADTGITDPKKKREIIDELTGQREEIAREIVRRAKILGVFE